MKLSEIDKNKRPPKNATIVEDNDWKNKLAQFDTFHLETLNICTKIELNSEECNINDENIRSLSELRF